MIQNTTVDVFLPRITRFQLDFYSNTGIFLVALPCCSQVHLLRHATPAFCSLQPQYIQQFSCLTAYCLSPLLEVNIKSRVLSPISFQTLLKYHLLWGQYPTNTCLKVRISQSSITALLMVQLLLGHFVQYEIYVSALNQLM